MAREPDALVERHRVTDGKDWKLADHAPADTGGLERAEAMKRLEATLLRLDPLQAKLFALRRWSVLLVFEGIDGSGKGDALQTVTRALNPQGFQVTSFQAPTDEDLDHDFLWRCARLLPRRGHLGAFVRSWYEEVVVVRVRPDLFAHQRLPEALLTRAIWKERCEDIVAFERHLARNGTHLLKFFLHVSLEEQQRRLLARAHEPLKSWNLSMDAVDERKRWPLYLSAYEDMVKATASAHAPWIVIPADVPWYPGVVVAAALADALEALELEFPERAPEAKRELKQVRRELGQPMPDAREG